MKCRSLSLAMLATLWIPALCHGQSSGATPEIEIDREAVPSQVEVHAGAGEGNRFFFSERRIFVDCDRGQTLGHALRRFGAKLNIEFRGTCEESVLIERDDVQLRGRDATAEVIGNIQVVGARRVLLEELTVRNGPPEGGAIDVANSASATLRNVKVFNASDRGIRIRDASAQIEGALIDTCVTVGILARGSHLGIEGTIEARNCAQAGVILTASSSNFSKEADFLLENNVYGMIVQNNSSHESVFGTLTTRNNQLAGVLVAGGGSFSYGVTELVSTGNALFGVWVDEGGSFTAFQGFIPTTTISGNGFAGIAVEKASSVDISGNTQITGNPIGVFVDESSFKAKDAVITGNSSKDGDFRFGSRITLDGGNQLDVYSCDADVLMRGESTCP